MHVVKYRRSLFNFSVFAADSLIIFSNFAKMLNLIFDSLTIITLLPSSATVNVIPGIARSRSAIRTVILKTEMIMSGENIQ